MTFLEWVDKLNQNRWMICTLFQVPVDDSYEWKVSIGLRKPPYTLITVQGRSPVSTIKKAWLQVKEKESNSKKVVIKKKRKER